MMFRMAWLLVVALAAAATPSWPQTERDAHRLVQAAAPFDGEVRKVDRDAGKITLKHGEMPSLDMPPMTMVFRVSDPALLDRVKVGDRVRFAAEKIGGQYTVTRIEPAERSVQ